MVRCQKWDNPNYFQCLLLPLLENGENQMGLHISQGAWDGTSRSFNEWKTWVAEQIGLPLNQMEGFGGTIPWSLITHPLESLLNHSDCGGFIQWQFCGSIADSLEEIMGKVRLPVEDWVLSHTDRFIKGCRRAFEKQENLEFS